MSSVECEERDRLEDPHALLGQGVRHAAWLGLEEVPSAVEAVKVLPVLPHLLVPRIPTLCADIRTLFEEYGLSRLIMVLVYANPLPTYMSVALLN